VFADGQLWTFRGVRLKTQVLRLTTLPEMPHYRPPYRWAHAVAAGVLFRLRTVGLTKVGVWLEGLEVPIPP
jgi:hypothetical protein